MPVLIVYGADLNAVDEVGFTPLAYAASPAVIDKGMAQLLIDAGVPVDATYAVTTGDIDLLRRLLADDPVSFEMLPLQKRS